MVAQVRNLQWWQDKDEGLSDIKDADNDDCNYCKWNKPVGWNDICLSLSIIYFDKSSGGDTVLRFPLHFKEFDF